MAQKLKKGFDFKTGARVNFYPNRYHTRARLKLSGWTDSLIKNRLTPTIYTDYQGRKKYYYIGSDVGAVLATDPKILAEIEKRKEDQDQDREAEKKVEVEALERFYAEKEDKFESTREHIQVIVFFAMRAYVKASDWPPNGFESFEDFVEVVHQRLRSHDCYAPKSVVRDVLSQKVRFGFESDPDYDDLGV